MVWKETSAGQLRCRLGATEEFFFKFCVVDHDTGREHWSVAADATIDIESKPSTSPEDKTTLLKHAWKALRFEHPQLAVAIDSKTLEKVYTVPTETGLDQWLNTTFQIGRAHV